MKNYSIFWATIIGAALFTACTMRKQQTAAIQYPAPLPDSLPLVFLPGIVSTDGLDFNAAFSPDGQTFYFSRSKNGKYVILQTTRNGEHWTTPVSSLPFDTLYSNADPFVTRDSSIYFISMRPKDAADTIDDFDIYRIKREANKWTAPEYLEGVNSDGTEYYKSLWRRRAISISPPIAKAISTCS